MSMDKQVSFYVESEPETISGGLVLIEGFTISAETMKKWGNPGRLKVTVEADDPVPDAHPRTAIGRKTTPSEPGTIHCNPKELG